MLAMVRGEKTAKHYPANHCRKNEPKLRVNNSIDSHVTLHGRPWWLNFQPLRKLPGTRLMRCRRAGHSNWRRIGTKRNRGKCHRSGKRQFGRTGIARKRRHAAFVRQIRQTPPPRIGSGAALPA
jgi:hypothetical protein